jgi:hypothetical protein
LEPPAPRTPMMIVGEITDRAALDMIETVLRLWRETQQQQATMDGQSAMRADQTERPPMSDGRVLSDLSATHPPTSDRITRTTERTTAASRVKYSIPQVLNGRTLKLKNPTPGMIRVVDFLRQHPGSRVLDVMDGTRLSRNTIANILTQLNSQGALEKSSVI